MKIHTQIIFLVGIILTSGFVANELNAATTVTLSKSEIVHGDFFDILGADFGSGSSEYSYVCFGSTDACVRGADIASRSGFEWSGTRIRMQLPSSGIPTNGEIIVVGEGSKTTCSAGLCTTSKTSIDKGRAQYWIKPSITSVLPSSVVKPGDQVTIVGNGLGDASGEVFFGTSQGHIISWSYRSVTVRAPSQMTTTTHSITVRSQNGKDAKTAYVVSAPFTHDDLSHRQYYLQQIDIPTLWEATAKRDVIVAVLDDGVYQNHPDLQANMWKNTKEIAGNKVDDDRNGFVDDYLGYNFWDTTAVVDPKGGHGTAIAGVIAAVRDNGIGIAGIAGRAKIMSVIVSDGNAVSFDAVKRGIEYAVNNGAQVINISAASLGTAGFNDSLTSSIQWAFDKGVIVVVAAGNRDINGGIGQNLNLIPESPVCNNSGRRILLGVAALNNTDSATDGRAKAPWASYGRNCVTISAPGVAITSTVPPAFQKDKLFYDTLDGSSFSSPIVAGVAAAFLSVHPELTAWEVMNRLVSASDPLDQYNPGYEGQLGGRVDAGRLVSNQSGSPRVISLEEKPVTAGDTTYITIDYYQSDYTLRLSNERSLDLAIPDTAVRVIAADTLEVTVPVNTPAGEYAVRVVSPERELLASQQKITVRARREAAPAELQQSISSVITPSQSFSETPGMRAPLPASQRNQQLVNRMRGYILLQVENIGEAWYLAPDTGTRYSLGRPSDAFAVMRKRGLGVPSDLIAKTTRYPKRFLGKILLDVEHNGEAYYVYPKDQKAYFLGRPSDAFSVMRRLGLGITNKDLSDIPLAQ